MIPDERLEELAENLRALASLQRLRLLHLLTEPRYGEEVGEALGVSRQSARKHLAKLEERGFVRSLNGRRASGPVTEYQVVPKRLFALGVDLGDLVKLEPEGGPRVEPTDRTVALPGDLDAEEGAEDEAPPTHHLLLVNGPDAGTRFALDGGVDRWTVGRDEDRDLSLRHDPFASGHHAEVQRDRRGHVLVDVYSANGTYLNFARIPRGGRVPLQMGDVVGVGHTFLVYQRP